MEIPEESVDDRSPCNERINHNNTEGIYVELNNQSSKNFRTVQDLKSELKAVKEENERILKAQEELQQNLGLKEAVMKEVENQNLGLILK